MEELDIIDHLDEIVPYLQPVINADRYRTVGYEVLGYWKRPEETIPLRSFFHDNAIPGDYKWEVDKHLYRTAVEKVLQQSNEALLFFNIHPSVHGELDAVEELMELFQEFEEKGFPPSRAVFEITVDGLEYELDELSHVLLYMKASGFQVVLDDVSINDTHLDQFSKLEPSIIKVDVSDLKSSSSYYTYSEILDTLAFFSRKLGSTLHFKGIEDQHQLQVAWKYGGRYFQGNFLASAQENPFSEGPDVQKIRNDVHSFIDHHHRQLSEQMSFLDYMDRCIHREWKDHSWKSYNQFLSGLAVTLEKEAYRMYICDQYGYQVTSNWTKTSGQAWIEEEDAMGKNWSWRVYFLDHVVEMQFNKNGKLSDKYRDIESNDILRTYSYPLEEGRYLFIDIDPVYLYERNWVV
ncbi:EAL domain-containing protein [Alkalicoccus urumqiensis]|uniref:EAL domain-containing protein n=1 Tax=Alkalicoccus urumqiensis TaxID=1548213 RepID=A0A2P6MDU3_ALKUR|nr:EAL domain-containing protein [Alkalicoccus urumqiensis]PRO64447.1 hypothetical protein C6I21_14705 [Alkalicoccus urumqiensis]